MQIKKNQLQVVLIAQLALYGLIGPGSVRTQAQTQPPAPEINPRPGGGNPVNLPPPPGFTSRTDYLKSFTNFDDVLEAYRNHLISKDEALWAHQQIANTNPQDIYGQVIDQYGQPVVGATVQGDLGLNVGTDNDADVVQTTETDAAGRFKFLGLHGTGLGIWPRKEGYDYDLKLPSRRPDNYVPDPNNPVVFTMWKLHGAEAMKHTKIHAYIPCDGTSTRFNLLSGLKDPTGQLLVSLTRTPLKIERRKPFDWSVTMTITNGGFHEITNLYANEAPVTGYQSSLKFDFPDNMTNWQATLTHSYYFEGEDGKIYGRMTINLAADFQPPPTLFDVEIYANPAGSRNLEFDPKKQK